MAMKPLAQAAMEHLRNVILPYWKGLKDDTYGGYYGYMGQDLVLDKKAEKGCILNSRILWFFSEAAMALGDASLREYADHAYRFMAEHCLDRVNGGVYWSMTCNGAPLDTTKHTYNQGFGIYALASYYRLTGSQEALQDAFRLFEMIEAHCTDEKGYLEAFTVDWQPESNEKLSENGVMAEKTMNTLLHVFEGYSGLYEATRNEAVGRAMERILGIYADKIWSPELKRQLVFFDANYNSIIDLYSYGHDIESSWLMDWGCGLLGRQELTQKISDINREMAVAVLEAAFDGRSLANECDRGEVNTDRIWWVQAETVLGILHLWEKLPGEEKYKEYAANAFRFIEEYLVDKRPGSEWFYSVTPEGTPIAGKPILESWKCPYHNGRMCLKIMEKEPEIYV